MLKSGKLKLADDMIVTAQEAANKAETVFTIYDETTETEIASGKIGGGGGGLVFDNIEVVNMVSDEYETGYLVRITEGSVNSVNNVATYNLGSTAQMVYIKCPQSEAVKCEAKWVDIDDEDNSLGTPTYVYDTEEIGGWIATFTQAEHGFVIDNEFKPKVIFTWSANEQ